MIQLDVLGCNPLATCLRRAVQSILQSVFIELFVPGPLELVSEKTTDVLERNRRSRAAARKCELWALDEGQENVSEASVVYAAAAFELCCFGTGKVIREAAITGYLSLRLVQF